MKTRICLVLALVSILFAAFTAEAADVRLRMLQSISGTEGSFMRGDTVTVSDTIATEWIGAGYAEYADGSWVEAFSSANQAIATNTLVTMTATETVDYLGEYANGAFTPKVDGWYHLQAATNWDVDTATGGLVSLVFYKGASDTYIADQRVATGGQDLFLCPSGILRLTTADTVTVKAWQSTSASRNIATSTIRIKRVQ